MVQTSHIELETRGNADMHDLTSEVRRSFIEQDSYPDS